MNHYKQLEEPEKYKRSAQQSDRTEIKLGDAVKILMEEEITPAQARFGSVLEKWNQMLPLQLREHCTIFDISDGWLKVIVDSPSYAHELQMCSPMLLEHLRRQCPGARIKKIKCVPG